MVINMNTYKKMPGRYWPIRLHIILSAFLIVLSPLFLPDLVFPEEIPCIMCHEALTKEKVLHPALQLGCPVCHLAIDAREIPHKKTNGKDKGLHSEQPDLCYPCHDEVMFNEKTVHAAVAMGCTICHNPHSSKNAKLLVTEPPDLCHMCHDQSMFTGATVHAAIAMGCPFCHNPHSSKNAKLLITEPPDLCFTCPDMSQPP
jgi:predicted CXXCH cytochrome family protein